MKRSLLWLLAVTCLAGLTVMGGCGSDSETVSFDAGDIVIVASNSVLSGSNVIWNMTLSNTSDINADLKLQIKLKAAGNATSFYTSPVHGEKLGKGETKTFNYADSGVVVPAGTTTVMAEYTYVATPD